MKLLIDDANLEKIKEISEYYPIDGVTTNPSILAKTGRNPYVVLKEIREFIGPDAELHAQVISLTTEEMVNEGRHMVEVLGEKAKTFVKIPTIPEGLKAMRILSNEGYKITATAIYNPLQGYLAAKSGADYAAPYINRIDNLGTSGIQVARTMQDIFMSSGYKTKTLAASFKNSLQVQELCELGIRAATLAPDVIENLIKHPCVDSAEKTFRSDFESLCGKGKTMYNCDRDD